MSSKTPTIGTCSKGKSQCHLPPFKSPRPVFHLPPAQKVLAHCPVRMGPPALPTPLGHIWKPPDPTQPSSYEYGCKQVTVLFSDTHCCTLSCKSSFLFAGHQRTKKKRKRRKQQLSLPEGKKCPSFSVTSFSLRARGHQRTPRGKAKPTKLCY